MGLTLPKPCLTKVIDRVGNEYCAAACASVNGYRTNMEDAHMLDAASGGDIAYFGIFDGHSGDQCSLWVGERMPGRLKALTEPITAETLERVCQEVDEEFLRQATADAGSTGTFCLIRKDGRLQIANVGDSRILHCRNGELLFATEDHKPYDAKEEERIMRAGGSVVNNRVDGDLAVSRAFGDSVFKVKGTRNYKEQKVIAIPDVTERNWQAGDVIVLACDGVFEGNFSNKEVAKFVHEQIPKSWNDLAVVAARVCDEAIRRGSKDNISCMVVQLVEGASKVKQFGETSFVPGPPFVRNHKASRTCYEQMARIGHTDLATALQRRYELLQAKEKNILAAKPPVMRTAFEMSDEVDLAAEVSFFGRGPSPGNAAAYFEGLARGEEGDEERRKRKRKKTWERKQISRKRKNLRDKQKEDNKNV